MGSAWLTSRHIGTTDKALAGDSEKSRRERARRLLTKYGITVAEYDGLLASQGGKCAVCDRLPKKIRLAVDHDHKGSGRESVRGLLCSTCNRKIVGVIERYKVAPSRLAAYLHAGRPFARES